jgi:flagellar M-ring protein FliF
MRFMDYSMDLGDPISMTLVERLTESVVPIIRGVLALLIVALVMILAVRPLLRRLNEPKSLEAAAKDPALAAPTGDAAASAANPGGVEGLEQSAETRERPMLPPATAEAGPASAVPSTARRAFEAMTADEEEPEYVTKQGIRGSIHRKNIDKIQHLADEKPEEVLRVLRSWLVTEAEA